MFWSWCSNAGIKTGQGAPLICFVGVTHRYPGASSTALDGINLSIEKGLFTAVIGPNGSGKSTLARHMNALLLPTAGRVTVDGMDTGDPRNAPEIRRRVGFVFQNPDNQLVGTTVEEDIAFGPRNIGLCPAEIKEVVCYSMEAAGLGEMARQPPHMLSGGQKQQLAIAGAMAMKPRCLVLDEPTSMLGPAGRRSVLELVKKLNSEQCMGVVLVTNFMEEAVFADRVLVVHGGRILLDGTPADVFKCDSLLAGIGLELPGPAELSRRLADYGIDLPGPALTVDELVGYLCRL